MTYTRTATAVRGALLAAALLTALPAPAAHAAPHGRFPGDWLYLTVTHGVAPTTDRRGTLLVCDPPVGHPHAAEACAQLQAANGDIDRIPPKYGVMCPMIYAPVTAHARGRWHGRLVTYRQTFANECTMKTRTGSVFALDD